MAIFAVWHVGIGNKRYKPGERLPEVDDATWKRLAEAGAIRTVYEENPPTSADFDTQATAWAGDHGDPVGPKGEPGGPILTEDEEDDDDALPEIDAAEGIVEEEPPVRSAKRKKACA
ncbi:MAG: hypothetical protein ACLUHE_12290 [Christensenellales bacterium]